MFDTSACVDLIFLFVTQVDLEGEGGRTTLYFLLLYLKVYPLSVSVSLSVCLSVCLSLSPLFPRLLFFKFISSDLHSTVE